MYSSNFELIKDQCALCRKCDLYRERLNILFGQGNENADILFVFDAPKGKDDLKAIPFSGKSGEILDKLLYLHDIDRQTDAFTTGIVKCKPTESRNPTEAEMDTCIEYLRSQVRHIKPKIILCFGENTAKKMIAPDFTLSRSHGQFIKKGKLFFMGTYHPDEITEDEEKRLLLLEDIQNLAQGVKKIKEGR